MSSTFKPALLLMGGRTMGVAVGFFIPIVLVRLFDQSEFGTYKQVFLIYATLYGVAQVGMAESLFYFLPPAGRSGGRYAANALIALGVAGLASFVLLAAAGPGLAQGMGNPALAGPVVLMGLYLLFMLMATVLEIAMISRQRYRLAAASYSASDLARALLYLLPLALWPGLEGLLLGAVTFAALRVAATLAFLAREFGRELRPDWSLLRRQAAYAGPFAVAVAIQIVQTNLHSYAVFYSFDAASFAIYSVGCLQIPLIDLVFSSASHVMMVRMGRARAEGRLDEARRILEDITRKLALVFFPLVCLLIVSARWLIELLFTPAYVAAAPIFMIWSASILASSFQVDGVLRVFARTRFIFFMHSVTLVLVMALIAPFLWMFGLPGAAAVSLIATLAAKSVGLWRIKRLLGAPLRSFLPWKALGATLLLSVAAGIPSWLVMVESGTGPLVTLLLGGTVFVAAYGTLALACGLVTRSEREALLLPLRRAVAAAPHPEETRAP
jgi:O-antigen/teichoic acid export membrane protein